MTEPTNFICDLCGFSSLDQQEILDHMSAVHDLDEPVMVGQIQQDQGQLTLVQADGSTTEIDLATWLNDQLASKPTDVITVQIALDLSRAPDTERSGIIAEIVQAIWRQAEPVIMTAVDQQTSQYDARHLDARAVFSVLAEGGQDRS